jgi:hypothetical protein
MRLAIWAWNPTRYNAPPLEIILELDKYEHKPLPTCNKDNEDILQYKVLPLTRARDFLSLEDAEEHKLGESTLYITVFDHKERTTRVYTRDNEIDMFYSTKSDAPIVDVGHFLLEVEIDVKINPKGDPVFSDSSILNSLRKHHRSILEHIHYRLGAGDVTKAYVIENSWTMKVEDTIRSTRRLHEDPGQNNGGHCMFSTVRQIRK